MCILQAHLFFIVLSHSLVSIGLEKHASRSSGYGSSLFLSLETSLLCFQPERKFIQAESSSGWIEEGLRSFSRRKNENRSLEEEEIAVWVPEWFLMWHYALGDENMEFIQFATVLDRRKADCVAI